MRAASLTSGAGRSIWGTLLLLAMAPFATASLASGQCNGGNGGGGGTGSGGGSATPPPASTPTDPAIPADPATYGGPADAETPGSPASPAPPTSSPRPAVTPGFALVPEGVTAGAQGVESHDWRAWWNRNQDRYFGLAAQRSREYFSATEAASLTVDGAADLNQDWTLGRYIDRLPRAESVLRSQLKESSSVADAALQSMARLGLPLDPKEFGSRLDATSTARWSALLALGLRGGSEDLTQLRRMLMQGNSTRVSEDRIAAAYALGIAGANHTNRTQRLEALRALGIAVGEPKLPRAVRVAAIEALGTAAHGLQSAAERAFAAQLVDQLLPWMRDPSLSREARAVLPVSLARLAVHNPMARSARAELSTLCIAQVQERSAGIAEQYGAVQALGLLIQPQEGDVDQKLALLSELALDSKNRDLRPAAIMAIGRAIGSLGWSDPSSERRGTKTLLQILRKGKSDSPRWASLALGVAAAEAEFAGHGTMPAEVSKVLMREHLGASANDLRTTTALALGLAGEFGAHELVREHALDRNSRQDLAESVDALALYGNPGDERALLRFSKRNHLDARVERSLARAFATAGIAHARLALYGEMERENGTTAAARYSVARQFPVADMFDLMAQHLVKKRADQVGVIGAIRGLGRMQEARPGALRGACLQDRNPYVGNLFETWMSEL